MGILTTITTDVDEDDGVKRVYAITKFGINNRTQLNRVASRAAVGEGVGQRSLVAAAYDEEGIDLVWTEGPFGSVAPEDKFEDAKKIEYRSSPMESASELGDILPPKIKDMVTFENYREGNTLHVWEIPLDLT